jgi:hypothetical protein
MVSGLTSSFDGQKMLDKLGIGSSSGLAITPRGNGTSLTATDAKGTSVSGSGYVGNASASDIKNLTMQEAEDSGKQQVVEAVEEAEANQVDMINTTVLKIYELLDGVTNGDKAFRVKVDSYGLVKSGTSALGGLGALNDAASGYGNTVSSGGGSIGGGYSGSAGGGVNGSIDLGGWVMV